MSITSLLRRYLTAPARDAGRWPGDTERLQRRLLSHLISRARNTLWGREHSYTRIATYEDYREAVPRPVAYEQLRPLVMRMIAGERDILWPGRITSYAQSSGTSDGASKYIPITPEGLRHCHYRGTRHSVAQYLTANPASRILDGRSFILGGSFATQLPHPPGVSIGDLSATLISRMPRAASLLRVPSRRIALMADWNEKLPALVSAAVRCRDITNISGVPSWFLTVLRESLRLTGATVIHDIWPRLEVFFHGGIAFGPYRDQYRAITDPGRMHYLENYNASEGFFAVQDNPGDPSMLLLLDTGTFYEFIPVTQTDSPDPDIIPAWQVAPGQTYALVISNLNGLWRYPLGDTVTVTSTDPLRIRIAGRTHHFINAFGEELMVWNADAAIEETMRQTGAAIANYTAAPLYADSRHRGCHQWVIEFTTPPRDGIDSFARLLDENLRRRNSDYDAKRSGNLFLDPLQIITARAGLFDSWLAVNGGRLGGQRKIPRLANDRRYIDTLLTLNSQ